MTIATRSSRPLTTSWPKSLDTLYGGCEFWRAMKLDVFGTFICSKIAIPRIAAAGGGSIINMSSIVALMALPGRDCYTAAKGSDFRTYPLHGS